MAKGFLKGTLAGVVVSALGLGAVSELLPLPHMTPANGLPAEAAPQEAESGTAPVPDQSTSAQAPESTGSETAGAAKPGTTPPTVSQDAGTSTAANRSSEPAPDTVGAAPGAPSAPQGGTAPEQVASAEISATPPQGAAPGAISAPGAAESAPEPAASAPPPGAVTAPAAPGALSPSDGGNVAAPGNESPVAEAPAPTPVPAPSSGGAAPKVLTPPPGPSVAITAPGGPVAAPDAGTAPAGPRTAEAAPRAPADAARPGQPSASEAPVETPQAPPAVRSLPKVLMPGELGTQAKVPAPANPLPRVSSGLPQIAGAPQPGFGNASGVRIGRLPTISAAPATPPSESQSEGGSASQPPADAPSAVPAPPAGRHIVLAPGVTPRTQLGAGAADTSATPPVKRYAAAFDNSSGRPLVSVVLIDTGGQIDRERLAKLPIDITFAIDPAMPGATEAARAYRAAGREVLILATGLPANATTRDISTAFEGWKATVPQAVGVLDAAEGGFETNRLMAETVVGEIRDRGLGLVTYARGLDAADEIAQSEEVPAAQVYRLLDAHDENAATIQRYLDRAAFKAAQEGRVVVVGHTRPDTVDGLSTWSGDPRAHTVALAPVTAAMKP